MANIILITGGGRSGKSAYAQSLAKDLTPSPAYIATCPALDDEMRRRIERHRKDRESHGWITIEEQLDLAGAIDRAHEREVVLVECLTLWINNIMYEAEQRSETLDEDTVAQRCALVLEAARKHPGTVIFVTNEVGMGIIPANAAARLYRDLAGRCNQAIGAQADKVVLLVCGIPTVIKGQ